MGIPKLTQEQVEELHRRHKAGESVAELAHGIGINKASLYRRFRIAYQQNAARWPQTLNIPEDPATVGYIAGIIDGEGSIAHIGRNKRHRMVRVTMIDREVIDFLASFGGGRVVKTVPAPPRQPYYTWHVARRLDVVELLSAVLPFLRVPSKRRSAEECLEVLKDL